MQDTATRNWSREMIMGFEALYAGRGRRNPVWSGKEAHWSLRELIDSWQNIAVQTINH